MMRFLFLLCCVYASLLNANPIEVSVDRNFIHLNESFNITFSTDKAPDENPDFLPLQTTFEILNKNHGSTMSWVNGQRSVKIQWVFTVMAKKAGQLNIPPINFGSENSPNVAINVIQNQPPTVVNIHKSDDPIFLEVSATPTNPYLQSQVTYTLRLFRRVNIVEANLTAPKLVDAIIERLGEDKDYEVDREGMTYKVTERRYAIFPQKSGIMNIKPLKLTAAVLANNSSRFNGFFGLQSTRKAQITSKAIKLTVQPIPVKVKHWLPAHKVKLSQHWSKNLEKIMVGEPLTRTLILEVEGVTKEQLPHLQTPTSLPHLKSYPDQPTLTEEPHNTRLIAFRTEKIAFIASKKGNYTLPEITVNWFNLQTQKIETARIPKTHIVVMGESVATHIKLPPEKADDTVRKIKKISAPSSSHSKNNGVWQGISAFLAIAWLITLFLLFHKKRPPSPSLQPDKTKINQRAAVKAIKQACQANDPQQVKETLLVWGQLKGYDSAHLSALAQQCHVRLQNEILHLNKKLYSQESFHWDGKNIFQAFSEHQAMARLKKNKKPEDPLEPLHKI